MLSQVSGQAAQVSRLRHQMVVPARSWTEWRFLQEVTLIPK
jgi:hypothetical protein